MADKETIIVDGANIAYIEQTQEGNPKVGNLSSVYSVLTQRGYDPVIIVDASLRHDIDQPQQLEQMIEDQQVHQAPAGTDADYFILETADRQGAQVVSNDDFDQYLQDYPWIEQRRVPLMIIEQNAKFYQLEQD